MTSDADTADRLTRKRARVFIVLAILLISQQSIYFSASSSPDVAHFKFGAWLFLTSILLLLLGTGGFMFRRSEVRAMMNDESTRAHRQRALVLGFWNTMVTGLLLYVLSIFKAFDPRDAIHVMMTVGIGTALIAFGTMERKALA